MNLKWEEKAHNAAHKQTPVRMTNNSKKTKMDLQRASEGVDDWDSYWLLMRIPKAVSTLENMHLPYVPAISLLGIYPREIKTYVHTDTVHKWLQKFYS